MNQTDFIDQIADELEFCKTLSQQLWRATLQERGKPDDI